MTDGLLGYFTNPNNLTQEGIQGGTDHSLFSLLQTPLPLPHPHRKKLMRITYFNEYFKNIIELDIYLDIYNSILVVHDEKMYEILNI